jgi:hypothetical protein
MRVRKLGAAWIIERLFTVGRANRVLYEQVPGVNFSFLGSLLLLFVIAIDVALHRVCIRTLMS